MKIRQITTCTEAGFDLLYVYNEARDCSIKKVCVVGSGERKRLYNRPEETRERER